MYRTTCGGCEVDKITPFLDLGKTPIPNIFPKKFDDKPETFPLGLCRCESCGLVQSTYVVPDDLLYGQDYGFYSGGSTAQREYHRRSAELLMTRYPDAKRVVEIAANDGSLLRHFLAHPQRYSTADVLGIDPSRPADIARKCGVPMIKEPFTKTLAWRLREEGGGPADLVICYNAAAHIADLGDLLRGIRVLLADDGVAVIEVQYLGDLIAGNLIGQIYLEHRFYYSLTALVRVAAIHGLSVLDAELIELQGGGLRVVLSRESGQPGSTRAAKIIHDERWLDDPAVYSSMQGRIDRNREHTLDLIHREVSQDRPVVGYAAAAKAVTIMNYYELDFLPVVLDTTPYKQGRFVPGVQVPIAAPTPWTPSRSGLEMQDVTRVLFASNYLAHLLRTDTDFLDHGGRWLVVEPAPMVI